MRQPDRVFPPELRTAFFVPRWSIVHTFEKDTVASHSYFVATYSMIIARLIQWQGPYDVLLWVALTHDLDETITGDIVSPVKREIVDYNKLNTYLERKMYSRLGYVMHICDHFGESTKPEVLDAIDQIVQAADRLDALLYLIMEERIGNRIVSALIRELTQRLEGSWRDLPAPKDVLDRTWQVDVLPSIEAHREEGGKGI